MSSETIDAEIRKLLRANDASALDIIWSAYADSLFGYLMGLLCSRHEAEDALQDVFVTIARKRRSVAQARQFKPYLFRLSRNVALNRIKRNKRARERLQAYSEGSMLDATDEAPNERTHQVEAALAQLPEKQRTVLMLKFFQEKTFREIGMLLGISENTAGSRYRYGIKKMQDYLREGLS